MFAGNTNDTSEVTHLFTTVRGGVRARYVRFVPLECTGGGAMRVGVYGEPAQDMPARTRKVIGTDTPARKREVDGDCNLIEYKLKTKGSTTASPLYVRDGLGVGGGKDWYRCASHSVNRRRRRLDAAREALQISSMSSSIHAKLVEELRGADEVSKDSSIQTRAGLFSSPLLTAATAPLMYAWIQVSSSGG